MRSTHYGAENESSTEGGNVAATHRSCWRLKVAFGLPAASCITLSSG